MHIHRLPVKALAALLLSGSLLASAAVQAQSPTTQQVNQIDKRVGTLESQMRAVQRQVFPGGDKRFFAPEVVAPEQPAAPAAGTPATTAVVDLTRRVDALESQQRELTGQIEQLRFQMKQATDALQKFRGDAEFRLDALEGKAPANAAAQPGVTPPVITPPAAAAKPAAKPALPVATTPEAITAQYEAGYALYTQQDYAGAEKALEAFTKAYPKHALSSKAWFWVGRSRLAQGQTAEAARAFTEGYRQFPQGERAHNSLLYLGKSLIDLKQPKAACQALDELQSRFADRITGSFAKDVTATSIQAKCA